MEYHRPVLLENVLTIFQPQPKDIFIDGTLGNGGHTIELLKSGATVYGLDADPTNLQIATDRIKKLSLQDNFIAINQNFSQTNQLISNINQPITGIILDLGLSSNQQKSINRGFSFNDNESLNMKINPQSDSPTAEEIINTYDFSELYHLFSYYAQEKLSKPIATQIIEQRKIRPIKKASLLAEIITNVYQKYHFKTVINPATKVFMALRIVVNQEFENLESFLRQSLKFGTGCTIIIISLHSGEDRIVKQFIKNHPITVLTPKPITPGFNEIKLNPLSRSAKLRSYRIS